MASAEEALRSTNAKANFQRLTWLLMRGGVVLLRETFDSIHSPANLPTVLINPTVQTLLKSAKLSRLEWNCLYPSPGLYGKSSDFDITLTFRLLRTICNLTPPATGWDSLPSNTDHTLEADLARVKYYRNEVYGHSSTMDISDAEFKDLWREVSQALLRIAAGISHDKRDEWKKAIDKFLHDPLTPDGDRCVEELSQWYKYDLDVKEAVEKLEESLQEIRGLLDSTLKQSKEELHQELRSIREDMRQHFVEHGGLAKVGDAAYGRKPRVVSSFGTYGSSVEKDVRMLDIEEDGSLKTAFNKTERQQSEVEGKEVSKTISGFEGKHVRGSSFEGQIQTRRFRPVLSFGEYGESAGKLNRPCGIAVNDQNEIAVTELNNDRVSVFSSDGTHLRSFGRQGRNQGEFDIPTGIAFDNNGNIIVADSYNNRVQVFSGNGEFLAKFGEKGNLDHQLQNPHGLSVTSNGDIIVADKGNKLIKIFSSRGQFKRKFGGHGSLSFPYHCIQAEKYFIVSEWVENCIKVFDIEGNFVFKFGKGGNKEGEFNHPRYLSVNRDGHLMVCDSMNDRVQVFELSGTFVTKFGTKGNGKGELNWPVSTANLSDGRIVVSDGYNHRIQIFELI